MFLVARAAPAVQEQPRRAASIRPPLFSEPSIGMPDRLFKVTFVADMRCGREKEHVFRWLNKWRAHVSLIDARDFDPSARIWDVQTPLLPLLDAPRDLFSLSAWAKSDGAQAYKVYDEYRFHGGEYSRCEYIRGALARGMRWR